MVDKPVTPDDYDEPEIQEVSRQWVRRRRALDPVLPSRVNEIKDPVGGGRSCPTCGSGTLQRVGKMPLEKALSPINPKTRVFCRNCRTSVRVFKPWPLAVLSMLTASLAVLVVLSGPSAMVQGMAEANEPSSLFAGVPDDLICPACVGGGVSRSVLRPQEAMADLMNPWKPYRCWGCRHRFWELKQGPAAWLSWFAGPLLLFVVVRGFTVYSRRHKEVRKFIGAGR